MTAPSPDVARTRFAAWVDRTVRAAYTRGLRVKDIERLTDVGSSTFDRWRKGAGNMPRPDLVRRFAEGLDVDWRPAFRALGWDSSGQSAAATEPEIDPDLRPIARRLADPRVPESEKLAIRNMLRLIGRQTVGDEQASA